MKGSHFPKLLIEELPTIFMRILGLTPFIALKSVTAFAKRLIKEMVARYYANIYKIWVYILCTQSKHKLLLLYVLL